MKKLTAIILSLALTLAIAPNIYAESNDIYIVNNWEEYFLAAENPELTNVKLADGFQGNIGDAELQARIDSTEWIVGDKDRTVDFNHQPAISTDYTVMPSINVSVKSNANPTVTIEHITQGSSASISLNGKMNAILDDITTYNPIKINGEVNVNIKDSVFDFFNPAPKQAIAEINGKANIKISSAIIMSPLIWTFSSYPSNSFRSIIDDDSEIYLNGKHFTDEQYSSSSVKIGPDGYLYTPWLEITSKKTPIPDFSVELHDWYLKTPSLEEDPVLPIPIVTFEKTGNPEIDRKFYRSLDFSWQKVGETEWHFFGGTGNKLAKDYAPTEPGEYLLRATIRMHGDYSSSEAYCRFTVYPEYKIIIKGEDPEISEGVIEEPLEEIPETPSGNSIIPEPYSGNEEITEEIIEDFPKIIEIKEPEAPEEIPETPSGNSIIPEPYSGNEEIPESTFFTIIFSIIEAILRIFSNILSF